MVRDQGEKKDGLSQGSCYFGVIYLSWARRSKKGRG